MTTKKVYSTNNNVVYEPIESEFWDILDGALWLYNGEESEQQETVAVFAAGEWAMFEVIE